MGKPSGRRLASEENQTHYFPCGAQKAARRGMQGRSNQKEWLSVRRDRSINLQQQSVLACSIKFFALKKNACTRMFAAAWSSLHQRMWFYLSRLNLKQNDFPSFQ
jgi:hypothetical protein